MSEKSVSVLIPAYNHEKYVQKTIQSIINQSYQNLELILINDGSKDSTWEKISEMKEECEKRFTRVVFETQENSGTCVTLNKLIKMAQGEYVYIIASDDMAKPDAIKKEVEFLENNPEYGLAVGDSKYIDSNDKICWYDRKLNLVYDIKSAKYRTVSEFLMPKRKRKKFGTYKSLYKSNYIPNGYTIRTSILKTIEPFSKEAPLEDWYLMLQLSKYSKFKFLDEILFYYRIHDSNTIKNTPKMKEYAVKTGLYEDEIMKRIDKTKVLPEVREIIENSGLFYKRIGIPYIFEMKAYRNHSVKRQEFRLFNKLIKTNYKKINYKI